MFDRENTAPAAIARAREPAIPELATEAGPAAPPVVELVKVTKAFDSGGAAPVAAVSELSLEVAADSAILVRGPSGSGKTTLLGIIGCLIRPTSGRIRVRGREVTRLPEERVAGVRRRQFGIVFQSHNLIRGATALANVMLPALPCAEVDGDLRRHARSLLARFGLADRGQERIERLSGGERQRVAIARALVNDPPVILADEPTAHLDPRAAKSFLDLVVELRAAGKTVLVASHDPILCQSSSFSRRLELHHGRLFGVLEAVPCS